MILTTLDKQGYSRKPEKKEIAKISKRIADCTCEVHDLKEFANLVANKGYTWCPTVFNGNRNIDNFVSIQLIALDFDGGVTFDEVKQKSEKYMIPILFAYETFSSIKRIGNSILIISRKITICQCSVRSSVLTAIIVRMIKTLSKL